MAPIYILFGFGLGFLLGKALRPSNVWEKLLWCICLPCLIYGYYSLIYGVDTNWNMYQVGLKTFSFFYSCIGLLVALLIFVKQPKFVKEDNNELTSLDEDCKIIESSDTNRVNNLYINKYLKLIFSIWMAGVGLSAIGPFVKLFYVGYGEEIVYGTVTFIISMMGVFSMYGMLNKKRWGLILCIIYGVARFMSYIIWRGSNMVGEIDVLISLVAFLTLVLLLFIREDDYPAYFVIWNNGKMPINETSQI